MIKLFSKAYASIHDQQLTIHARAILLVLILLKMVQTLPARGDSIQN